MNPNHLLGLAQLQPKLLVLFVQKFFIDLLLALHLPYNNNNTSIPLINISININININLNILTGLILTFAFSFDLHQVKNIYAFAKLGFNKKNE
jgi:hypothetical protein